jgi:flagellar basal-body rod modification protein FlgD
MKNQDPTADTDPNEYINQLVNVNSLEQLISINQTLTSAYDSSSSSSSTTGTKGISSTGTTAQVQNANSGTASALQQAQSALTGNTNSPSAQSFGGNIGVSNVSSSAQALAHALDGRSSSTNSGLSSKSQ